jgi:putative phosphoribosyl transferase
MVVRKIGMPGQRELAIGAIASGGIVVRDKGIGVVDDAVFRRLVASERRELVRRERAYRGDKATMELRGKSVVLVDDGLATGATMTAAVRAARKAGALAIVVAAPVASSEAVERLAAEADRVVILETPPLLYAIGEWYERFDQLEDQEVQDALGQAESISS